METPLCLGECCTMTKGRDHLSSRAKSRFLKLCLIINVIPFLLVVSALLIRALSVREHDYLRDVNTDNTTLLPSTDARFNRLRDVLKFRTVSWTKGNSSTDETLKMIDYIKMAFPTVHNSPYVEWEIIAEYSLLYRVKGSDETRLPYMFSAHLDVVPANPDKWDYPPFNGELVNDTYIYGRGTLDDKSAVMAILEALEALLLRGHQPIRSFIVGFGHDEEVTGYYGARNIAKRLEDYGITRLDFVHDEGMFITTDFLKGMEVPVAMVGVTEKGYAIFEVSVNGSSGHASVPPWETTIGILSAAISRLEVAQHPQMFMSGPLVDTLHEAAPYAKFFYRLLYSNLWFFGPLVGWMLSRNQVTDTLIRTSTAITQFHAGIKNNVLPDRAIAYINHRIYPGQTVEDIIRIDKELMADARVDIKVIYGMDPHPIAEHQTDSKAYITISKALHKIFGRLAVVPMLLVANTDSVHYLKLTQNIYRFSPFMLELSDVSRIHGDNERITKKNYMEFVNYIYLLMINSESDVKIAAKKKKRDL